VLSSPRRIAILFWSVLLYGEADQGRPAWNKDENCLLPENLPLDDNYHQLDARFDGGGAQSDLNAADIPAGIHLDISGNHYWAVTSPMGLSVKPGYARIRTFKIHTYCGPATPPGPGCNIRVKVYARKAPGSREYPKNFTGWSSIFDRNRLSTVWLRVEDSGKGPDFGSGVFINSAKQVLTARHNLTDDPHSPTLLVTGIAGWNKPSVNLAESFRLKVEYVSERYDIAVLNLLPGSHDPPLGQDFVFADSDIHQAQDLLVMGYPDGDNLAATPGIASKPVADDQYATNAEVGIGNSGGPVFAPSGGLLGIVLSKTNANSNSTQPGRITLAHFLTVSPIQKELNTHGISMNQTPNGAQGVTSPLSTEIKFEYPVDIEQGEPTQQMFKQTFAAQNGFGILSANFRNGGVDRSAHHLQITISRDRKQVSISVRSPVKDHPILGTLETRQIREVLDTGAQQ